MADPISLKDSDRRLNLQIIVHLMRETARFIKRYSPRFSKILIFIFQYFRFIVHWREKQGLSTDISSLSLTIQIFRPVLGSCSIKNSGILDFLYMPSLNGMVVHNNTYFLDTSTLRWHIYYYFGYHYYYCYCYYCCYCYYYCYNYFHYYLL